MKLLLTADCCGGVLTWALELATQLAGAGDEVELVTFGPPASSAQRERIAASGVGAWYQRDLALEWMADPWNDLAAAVEVLRELEHAGRPDVIHLSSFGHAAAGFRVPTVVTAHSDVWSWWQAVHGWDPPHSWDRYREWVRGGLRAADAVIAPTTATLAELRRSYGPWPGRTLVIHNAVRAADAPAARPGVPAAPTAEAAVATAEAAVATAAREPVVLAAGRLWDAAKNVEALVRAAECFPPGTVRIAGDPSGGPDLAPAVVLGELSAAELATERRRAAVFAAPARYEPFGLAVLEAALDGCALVLGDIPSLRELWDDAACFVDPDEPDELVQAIRSLIGDLAGARERGEDARRRARTLGGTEAFGHAHRRLYEELARAGTEDGDIGPDRAIGR